MIVSETKAPFSRSGPQGPSFFPRTSLRFSCGQRHREDRQAVFAGCRQAPLVEGDNLPGDGQAQPGPLRVPASVQPVELLENPVQLFPQTPNVGHDGAVVLEEFLPPPRLEQLLGGDHGPLPLTEIPEDGELDGGQGQLLSVQEALVGVPVDDKAPDVVLPLLVPGSAPRRTPLF